jgi:CubicO group peptidase (beta-lactamase class C family)
MTEKVFPKQDWETVSPAGAGFAPEELGKARQWLDDRMDDKHYRLVIVRGGRVVLEHNHNIDRDKPLGIASAAKSIYSNILGIVVDEKKIPSADARVYDYYPEMMDVPEGEGPKDNRYAFEKDREITFRQLISNTSGYMKPGEIPGTVFHYQTYGMNILTHSLAKIYRLYDISDPEGSPGFKSLIEEKLARVIGVNWKYSLSNFNLHKKARLNIFGYYCQVHSNALDLARLGWMWCNWGRWGDKQIVPEAWMRESVKTNPDVASNSAELDWKYGYGIWTNDNGQLWPELPRSGFTASGAGGHYVSVFPEDELVVVQNPGRYRRDKDGTPERGSPELLKIILDAIRESK